MIIFKSSVSKSRLIFLCCFFMVLFPGIVDGVQVAEYSLGVIELTDIELGEITNTY